MCCCTPTLGNVISRSFMSFEDIFAWFALPEHLEANDVVVDSRDKK